MKVWRNKITILFFLVSVINLIIFFYRDKFIYHKYATRSSLYSEDTLKWKKLVYDYSNQELIEGKKILDGLLNLNNKPTSSKVLEIGKLLYRRFHKQIGIPSASLSAGTILDQFKILDSSSSEHLWCGNFAAMLAFFCWSEGIPCRYIEIINPGDHHVVNECYLKETKEWVMSDITTNHLLLFNKNKDKFENLLNTRDSLTDPLQSFEAADDKIIVNSFQRDFYGKYFGEGNTINYYYRINNFELYKPTEKIRRYFLPTAWYEEVNKDPVSNFYFYLKQFFILLWLICLIFFLGQFIPFSKFKKV